MFLILVFILLPKFLYLFNYSFSKLPNKQQRFKYKDTVLDDIKIIDDNNFFKENINLIIRSRIKNIDYSRKNTILLNFTSKINTEHNQNLNNSEDIDVIVIKKNCLYATCNYRDSNIYMKNKLPVIFIDRVYIENGIEKRLNKFPNEVYKYCKSRKDSFFLKVSLNSNCKTLRPGSGVITALTLAKLCNQINIYGWDFYLNKSPKTFSLISTLFLLNNKELDKLYNFSFFEYSLFHWLFVNRLNELNKVNVYGNLTGISEHKYILKLLKKVYYQ